MSWIQVQHGVLFVVGAIASVLYIFCNLLCFYHMCCECRRNCRRASNAEDAEEEAEIARLLLWVRQLGVPFIC